MKLRILILSIISVSLLIACGQDDGGTLSVDDRIKGTWIQSGFNVDCTDDMLDEMLELTCDDLNCRRIVLGDSSFVSVNLVNGVESRIEEFYLFVVDVNGDRQDSSIEVCDGINFTRNCNRTFMVSQNGNRLSLIRESDDDGCIDTIVYTRDSEADG